MTSIFDKIPKEKRNRYIRWRYKQLIMKYKPTEEFKGDILLFKAKETNIGNQYFGWDRVCKNINVITFEGNHSAMYDDQESVNIIKENIAEWINNNEESNGKKAVS